MARNFPRPVMLAQGLVLGTLGILSVLLVLLSIVRKRGTPFTAACLALLLLLTEMQLFGRLPFMTGSLETLLLSVSLAAALIFMTAILKPARENILLGLILFAGIVAVLAAGIADYFGFFEGGKYLPLALLAVLALFVVLSVQQGISGDRRAMALTFASLLATGALAAMLIGAHNGIGNWIAAVLPHAMLTVAMVIAGIAALFRPGGTDVLSSDAAAFREPQPAPAFAVDPAEDEPVLAAPEKANRKDKKRGRKKDRKEPVRQEPSLLTDVSNEQDEETAPREPVSIRRAAPAVAAATTAAIAGSGDIRALLGAAGKPCWEWADDEVVEADDAFTAATGLAPANLTPEILRGQIAHEDLTAYDEAILGGSDPKKGRFALDLGLLNGGRLKLRGMRFVDEFGIVSRLVAFLETADSAPSTEAAPAPAFAKADIDALAIALREGHIKAWFQPVVSLPDGGTAGFETLARWHHPDGRIITAEEFLPLAAAGNLEQDLFEHILEKAAAELAAWVQGGNHQGEFVSVNMTAQNLASDKLLKRVASVINQYALPAGSLVLELTEEQVHDNQAKALKMVKALHNLGVRIALDDLGSGYSSLNQLGKFRFDIVKTDKSLLTDIEYNEHAQTLLGGICDLSRKLGMQIIAEGVETQGAAKLVAQMGCTMAQGYYFGEPAPADDAGVNATPAAPPLDQLR